MDFKFVAVVGEILADMAKKAKQECRLILKFEKLGHVRLRVTICGPKYLPIFNNRNPKSIVFFRGIYVQ